MASNAAAAKRLRWKYTPLHTNRKTNGGDIFLATSDSLAVNPPSGEEISLKRQKMDLARRFGKDMVGGCIFFLLLEDPDRASRWTPLAIFLSPELNPEQSKHDTSILQ
ncbi:hypothetical protein L915_12729 [Phytophthora nicotianae]|uniref:Uncharacterized protein n=2 Tax=Phytophthora nicotianae TaxID=4792 RepID=V9ER69_PHYNI|nr:hypothetical protein F443_13030 [Phytophthora nicotianae P1569]ETK81794.1 hypothetical protein L915_12729 [Phytophthora nicotianae]ETM41692.1 hypothetical protein L914_12553 [Phytophthora nicotianae]